MKQIPKGMLKNPDKPKCQISRKYCEHPILTKKRGMKKHSPMTELAMARFKECINTAYVAVTNASIIAPMADMDRQKASEASRKEKVSN